MSGAKIIQISLYSLIVALITSEHLIFIIYWETGHKRYSGHKRNIYPIGNWIPFENPERKSLSISDTISQIKIQIRYLDSHKDSSVGGTIPRFLDFPPRFLAFPSGFSAQLDYFNRAHSNFKVSNLKPVSNARSFKSVIQLVRLVNSSRSNCKDLFFNIHWPVIF